KSYGVCDGAGSSVASEACIVACNSSSGILYGVACTSDGMCGGGSCVETAGSCKTDGGACAAIPYATNFSAAGPGKINVIDFSNATRARVEGVTVYDHRR